MARFIRGDLFLITDIITSADEINRMGIIAGSRGIFVSLMGNAPISEIKSVVTSSFTSSSPICLFPMIFSIILRITYIIMVLINIDVMKNTPCF